MSEKIFIRTNGRGNAWPIPLGGDNPFYNKEMEDFANASFSILNSNDKSSLSHSSIKWDILVDAGHGVIQYYLQNFNRIPEALILTHPHHDHTFSADWIAQSFYRKHNKTIKYPLYASRLCWESFCKNYPQLVEIIKFKEISYGQEIEIEEAQGLKLTPFPVFHGPSAVGACMLLFNFEGKKFIFTGDVLLPLISRKEIELLSNPQVIYVDTNNRFPYPKSNHWSITDGKSEGKQNYFLSWEYNKNIAHFIAPHSAPNQSKVNEAYLNHYIKDEIESPLNCFSIFDFAKLVNTQKVNLVHYGGSEDSLYHDSKKLNTEQLINWTNNQLDFYRIQNIKFNAPQIGEIESL